MTGDTVPGRGMLWEISAKKDRRKRENVSSATVLGRSYVVIVRWHG